MRIRTYSELTNLETFEERFQYLRIGGSVGRSTFGTDRWINQRFYTSQQWRQVRSVVITRDFGCDLGVEGYEIHEGLYIHHMNPLTVSDIIDGEDALDPEFLITTTHSTHNAIHYGNHEHAPRQLIERRPGDTRLW